MPNAPFAPNPGEAPVTSILMPSVIDAQSVKPNLIYTICFDAPDSESTRYLAKMLVSSLLRTYFTGDIVVFRNSPNPLFLVERKGLEEIYVDTDQLAGMEGAEDSWCWKYKVAELLDVSGYDKVLFLDADMLALRNVDHLLEGDWDISYVPERGHPLIEDSYSAFWTGEEIQDFRCKIQAGLTPALTGVNSGTLAVRAEIFHEVMAAWREIDEGTRKVELGFRDQASWNALLMRHTTKGSFQQECPTPADRPASETEILKSENSPPPAPKHPKWTAQPFPSGEVQFPMYLDPDYHSYTQAALTHNCGGNTLVKIQFTFGLYMRTFFCDPTGLFFSILET